MSSFTRLCDAVVEEPMRHPTAQGWLHAVMYRRADGGHGLPVVIAPPDGEERDWAQRSLVTAARVLANQGCTVVRFDYFGQGESDGNYEETTVGSRVSDLLSVWDGLAASTGRAPVVIGVRVGAPIALLAARERREIPSVVWWEPVVDVPQYLHTLLRVNVSTQMVAHGRVIKERQELIADARAGGLVSVNGYALSGALIDGLLGLDVTAELDAFDRRVLAVASVPIVPRIASHARVRFARVTAPPIWKEPKIHVTTPTPMLAPTVQWLTTEMVAVSEAS